MVASIGPTCVNAALRAVHASQKIATPTYTEAIFRAATTPANYVPLLNTAPIVKEAGIFKKVCEFLFGSWGPALGTEYHKYRQAIKSGAKLGKFDWIAKYKEVTSTAAKEAAKQAAKDAGKTGILKKIGGLFGKAIGPILFLGPSVISAIGDLKEGNIGAAAKDLTKGVLSMLGWTLGGIVASAVLGSGGLVVGIGTLLISSVVGMGIDFSLTKILGPSGSEQRALLAANQKQQQNNPFAQGGTQNQNAFARSAMGDRSLASFGNCSTGSGLSGQEMAMLNTISENSKNLFESRNNFAMI